VSGTRGYEISTDRARLDRDVIHRFLRDVSYWARGIEFEPLDRSIEGSLCFGLYAPDGSQAGFARLVSDGARFAYLADVFVLPEHRGRGLGKWLVATVMEHPAAHDAQTVLLFTDDAHGLYRRFGFGSAPRERVPRLMLRIGPKR
jgi:GNAT superfamily N-acetyltransferase